MKNGEVDLADAIEMPIDGVLDLHTFQPKEVESLLIDYLFECREKDILYVRIIHGKGTGQLRQKVHSVIKKIPWVISFRLADEELGGWGVTTVELACKNRRQETV